MLGVYCDAVPSDALVREATSRIETQTLLGLELRMSMVRHLLNVKQG